MPFKKYPSTTVGSKSSTYFRATYSGKKVAPYRSTSAKVYIDPRAVYSDLLPDLKESSSDFAWGCCPFHDDNNPSFCVNLESGWYKCHSSSCGVTGSNIVGFVSALLAYEYAEARQYLEQNYG